MKRTMLLYMLEADVGAPVEVGNVLRVNGRDMKVVVLSRKENMVTLEG